VRHVSCLLLLVAFTAFAAREAIAHGGSFRGPPGGVPPGARPPGDPEPPPPPPSNPGTPDGGETTPGEDPRPPAPETTPPDHDPTGGASPQPPQPTPQGNTRARAKTPSLTYDSWRFWWGYNSDDILALKSHIFAKQVSSSSPLIYVSRDDEHNVRDPQRPTQAALEQVVIPALRNLLERGVDHEDILGGCAVALGKVGSAREIALLSDALRNRLVGPSGRRVDLGPQATESAALALGLLRDLDDAAKLAVRKICLEIVADAGAARTRERTWCAVSLGLQRDEGAVAPLLALLSAPYADENVPAGILTALGLIGSREAVPALETIVTERRYAGRDFGPRAQAFAVLALGKIGDPDSLPTILKILGSRRHGSFSKRSAAIAAGLLGARASADARDRAVTALLRFVDRSRGDPASENFALIALSRIGTPKAVQALLDVAVDGKYGQRPFAALGLATLVHYRARANDPLDPTLRDRIIAMLRKQSEKLRDNDTRSAFLLCRGLVKDTTAIETLTNVVAERGADATVRGYACVALGLLGKPTSDVRRVLRLALQERRSVDLRRDAATGLSLLHDSDAVDLLLGELRQAKSFAVQGQIITAIGTIGDHRAIAPLVELLGDRGQSAQTRAMAAVGLGMIGDLRELPELARLSKDYNYRATVPDLDELLFIL